MIDRWHGRLVSAVTYLIVAVLLVGIASLLVRGVWKLVIGHYRYGLSQIGWAAFASGFIVIAMAIRQWGQRRAGDAH